MICWIFRGPLIFGLSLFLLSGCAPLEQWANGGQLPPQPSASGITKPGATESFFSRKGKTDDLLIYYQLVQAMTPAQQDKEYEQAKTDFARTGRGEDRLRLALVSLLPGRLPAERGQAAKLVEEYLADNGRENTSLDALAVVLKQLLGEQRGLQRQLNAEKEKSEGLARQLNEQKIQVDELKKQLDDLKKIEKIISERERKGLPEKRQ